MIIIIIIVIIIIIIPNELEFHVHVDYTGEGNVNSYSDIRQFYLTLLYQLQILLSIVNVHVR